MKKRWSLILKKTQKSPKKGATSSLNPTTDATHSPHELQERSVNLITTGTLLSGKIVFDQSTRMSGHIQGEVESRAGTALIITQEGLVEGNITGDEIIIQGFVEGEVKATKRIHITSGGRVLGNVTSPSVEVDFGAWFEGECRAGDWTAAPPTP